MKSKKNKSRGFTLIEVLATLTILAIILLVLFPSINGLKRKFNTSYYHTVEGTLKTAAMGYFAEHKNERPVQIGAIITKNSAELEGYINGTIRDKNKDEISSDNAYVVIKKTSKNSYEYHSCIYVEDYQSSDYDITCNPKWTHIEKIKDEILNMSTQYNSYQAMINHIKTDGTGSFLPNGGVKKTNYTKEGETNSQIISPEKYQLYKNGSLINTKNNIDDIGAALLRNMYGTSYLTLTEAQFNDQLISLGNQKYVIIYKYRIDGEEKIKTIKIKYKKIPAPPVIKVTLSSSDSKGYLKDTDDMEKVSWTKYQVEAVIEPAANSPTKDIKKYYCDEVDCNITPNDGKITITYQNTNQLVSIYGVSEDNQKSNTIRFGVKTDSTAPYAPTVTVYKKKDCENISSSSGLSKLTSNDWYSGCVLAVADTTKDRIGNSESNASGGVYYLLTTNGQGDSDVTDSRQRNRNVGAQGGVTLKYRACDQLDNCSSETTKVIKLDRTAPTGVKSYVKEGSGDAKLVSSYDQSWTKSTTAWGNPTATDTHSGVDHYLYYSVFEDYATAHKFVGDTGDNKVYHYPLGDLDYGNHAFKIAAVDKAGNVSAKSDIYHFRVDQSSPVIKITKKLYGANQCNGQSSSYYAVNADFSVSDTGSGVKSVKAFFGLKNQNCDFGTYGINKTGASTISFGSHCNIGGNGSFTGHASDYRLKITATDYVGHRTTKYFDPGDAANSTGHNFTGTCSY